MDLKLEKIDKIIPSDREFSIQNNARSYLSGNRIPCGSAGAGLMAKVQDLTKKHGKVYYWLIKLFAPVLVSAAYQKNIANLLGNNGRDKVIINLGSGPNIFMNRKDIINVDIFAFDEVDIVADASNLPIEDGTVDLIINAAMMEHVSNPQKIVSEMYRILNSEGKIFSYLPYIVPYHAAPHDYQRWSKSGVEELFSGFSNVEVGIGAGPTSGMLWVLQEWLAILFSLGNKTLHDLLFMILMLLTSPIKLFDIVLEKFPYAEKIASGFYIVAEK